MSRLGLLGISLHQSIAELLPFIFTSEIRLILFPLNILNVNGWNLTIFCICIDTDMILVGIVMCRFAQLLKEYLPLNYVRILYEI